MPDSPMPNEGPAEQSQDSAGQGGDVAAKIQELDGNLSQFLQAALESSSVPDSVKAKLSAVGDAWKAAMDELSGGGGGDVTTPEQGASGGAQPMSMGRRG